MFKIQTLNAISDIIHTQLSADTYPLIPVDIIFFLILANEILFRFGRFHRGICG